MWRNSLIWGATAALLGVFILDHPVPAADQASQAAPAAALSPAVWTAKELRFSFIGFTAHYSCDGLRDRMKHLLLKLGAREDLDVQPAACPSGYGRPDFFPTVTIKMHVLAPADASNALPGVPIIPAQWKSVDVPSQGDLVKAAGDCELIEEFKHSVLPLFTTRNVQYRSTCVPNQLTPGGTWLVAEVLVTNQTAPKPPGT